MSTPVRIEGTWPEPIVLSRGWAKATARPWNDEDPAPMLRLERGASDFLSTVTQTLADMAGGSVYSPAIYPGSTRIWARCGYDEVAQLRVMERPLSRPIGPPKQEVAETDDPDWDRLHALDREAFEGFWRLGVSGLKEARAATRRATVLEVRNEDDLTGYAIVGSQWNVAYLQRLAVHPAHTGQGLGADLIRAALRWGRSTGSPVMVLNVRDENTRARHVYGQEGFVSTDMLLRVLRYDE